MVHIYVSEVQPISAALSNSSTAKNSRLSLLTVPSRPPSSFSAAVLKNLSLSLPTDPNRSLPSSASSTSKGTGKPSKLSDFLKALRPIIVPLTLVGIQPSTTVSGTRKKRTVVRWWNVLALSYLHVITVKDLAVVASTPGGQDFWSQITTLLRSGAATVTADIYVLRQASLRRLFRRVSVQYERFGESERRAFRRRIWLGSLGVLLFLASYFGVSVAAAHDMGGESFLSVYLFSAPVDRVPLPSPALFLICCLFMLVRHLVMWGTVAFLVVLYVALCDAVKMSFRFFNRSLADTMDQSVNVVDASRLQALGAQFENRACILRLLDDVFSPIIFFWYSSFLLSVCIEITFDITLYSRVEKCSLLRSALKLLALFVAYALIGISASLAVEESQKGVAIFNGMSSRHPPQRDLHVGQAYQMLGSQMASTRLALTGWKFFSLNRSYMLTVVGIVASYVIIVVQLNPHFMTKIISG